MRFLNSSSSLVLSLLWAGCTTTPVQVDIDSVGEVIGSFVGAGVYRFVDGIGWQFLTPTFAIQVGIAIYVAGSVAGYPFALRHTFLGRLAVLTDSFEVHPAEIVVGNMGEVAAVELADQVAIVARKLRLERNSHYQKKKGQKSTTSSKLNCPAHTAPSSPANAFAV